MQQMSFIQIEQPPEYRPRVKDLPARERPVNRLREAGPGALSTTEVLACILQTSNALEQARELLTRFEGLPGLMRACEAEIVQVDGIGPAQAARIQAARECGRRVLMARPEDRFTVRSPMDASQLLMAEMSHLEQEHFRGLLLDTRNRVMATITLYIGCLNASHIRAAEESQRTAPARTAGAVLLCLVCDAVAPPRY